MAEGGKKNYAKSERLITICTCKGVPPEDVTCEFCPQERKRSDGKCLYYNKSMEHCGCYEAQMEARK